MYKHRPELKMDHYTACYVFPSEIIQHTNRKDDDVLLFWEVKYAFPSCLKQKEKVLVTSISTL